MIYTRPYCASVRPYLTLRCPVLSCPTNSVLVLFNHDQSCPYPDPHLPSSLYLGFTLPYSILSDLALPGLSQRCPQIITQPCSIFTLLGSTLSRLTLSSFTSSGPAGTPCTGLKLPWAGQTFPCPDLTQPCSYPILTGPTLRVSNPSLKDV